MTSDQTIRIRQATAQGYIECPKGGIFDISYPDSDKRRGRVQGGGELCPTITASSNGLCVNEGTDNTHDTMARYRIRKLTPKECFRLMDVEDSDIQKIQEAGISKTQQYKMAGNSIVVACLDHILEAYFFPKERPKAKGPVQLTLF